MECVYETPSLGMVKFSLSKTIHLGSHLDGRDEMGGDDVRKYLFEEEGDWIKRMVRIKEWRKKKRQISIKTDNLKLVRISQKVELSYVCVYGFVPSERLVKRLKQNIFKKFIFRWISLKNLIKEQKKLWKVVMERFSKGRWWSYKKETDLYGLLSWF